MEGATVAAEGRGTRQSGVTLVEVLITVVVSSIGLLGMAALQARGQMAEVESYQRAQALVLLEDMANRMNANRQFRDCYDVSALFPYLGTGSAFAPTGCHGGADTDLDAWSDLLAGTAEAMDGNSVGAMLGARGCILRRANNLFEISVVWQGRSPAASPPAGNTCGAGLYGDERQRRVVMRSVRFGTLD